MANGLRSPSYGYWINADTRVNEIEKNHWHLTYQPSGSIPFTVQQSVRCRRSEIVPVAEHLPNLYDNKGSLLSNADQHLEDYIKSLNFSKEPYYGWANIANLHKTLVAEASFSTLGILPSLYECASSKNVTAKSALRLVLDEIHPIYSYVLLAPMTHLPLMINNYHVANQRRHVSTGYSDVAVIYKWRLTRGV